MATLREIESSLPGGFHDARVHSCTLGFADRSVSFCLELCIGDPDSSDPKMREGYRAATLKLEGVVACEVESAHSITLLLPGKALWVDLSEHDGDIFAGREFPADVFRASFFVQEWNSSISIAAQQAELVWDAASAIPTKVYLDDERTPPDGWRLVRWPEEAIALLQAGVVTDLSLDHDLGDDDHGTGYDVLVWLEEAVATRGFTPPCISIHSANPSARVRMTAALQSIERWHRQNMERQ